MHRWDGSVRQDQMAVGDLGSVLVCAVADGVGGEDESHLGSAYLARFVTAWKNLVGLLRGTHEELSCAHLASGLEREAAGRGLAAHRLSSTLSFAVVDKQGTSAEDGALRWSLALAQIGDSHIYRLRGGRWSNLTAVERDGVGSELASTQVAPLPKHNSARVWRLSAHPGDVIALTTDGVGLPLDDVPEYASALSALWETGRAPSPAELLDVVDGNIKSYDDDRTIVAIRFGLI
ncbi:protein phosphatase 2C domain-containing protein [Micropruina sp.]|uniref:protein phosphatase 2C domain-containing protein n=1 Tax=Micropruina sp. TaxID=2737536 RepID=UPI0039E68A93